MITGKSMESLGLDIFNAAKSVLGKKSKEIEKYLQEEAEKLATTLSMIEAGRLKGDISQGEARALWEMQKHASLAVLAAAEGMGQIAAEQAINVGLAVVRDFVNGKVGFDLL
jgi:hypothetical protein